MSAPHIGEDWEQQLRLLEQGWDLDGSDPITEAAIRAAKLFYVVPCSNGGIQIETHQSGLDIEINIEPDGRISSVLVRPAKKVKEKR